VSNIEYEFDGRRSLYSTTDLKGKITYANPYFIEVSGFSEEELIGKPHNILRHPDMPPVAFADLWATIKSGLPWTAMVKNRRKNGDYYWVLATVTPIMQNGVTTGYISVRTKPTREQIDAAAKLYKDENDHPGRLALRQGRVVRPGRLGRLIASGQVSLGRRIALTQSFLLVVIGVLGWAAWNSGVIAGSEFHIPTALSAVAMTVVALFWYYLATKVVVPFKTALRTAQGMAGGDLTATIEADRTDELGQLILALRQMNTNLHCIIGDIRDNLENMHTATREIATGNTDLSARTDSQAAALEETAASMEQLAATVQKNAEKYQSRQGRRPQRHGHRRKRRNDHDAGRHNNRRNQRIISEDFQHRWNHQRYCLANQSAGA
jgi:aerotaxis receptor